MLQIRKFAEERKVWESEREQLTREKDDAMKELSKLTEEIERLRSRGPGEEARAACPVADASLQAEIDSLKSDLEQERSKSRDLERKASEAESANERLIADIERLRAGPMRTSLELDCTRFSMEERPTTTTVGRPTCEGPREELLVMRRCLDEKAEELRNLEAETEKLKSELSGEKQKVTDLKVAANDRATAWKEELAKISDQIGNTQSLEEELIKLRSEKAAYDKNLAAVRERETSARREAEMMQDEIFQARRARKHAQHKVNEKDEELEALSSTVGSQLVAVEEELTRQVQQTSRLLELFLQHTTGPLTILRRSCKRIAAQGHAGNAEWVKQAPPLHNSDVNDLQNNLVKVVNLLRFASDILEARDQIQGQKGVISRIDELNETAKGWLQTVMGQPVVNPGDCC